MDKSEAWNTKISLFDYIIRTLIVLLPFTTVLSVFTSQKLWIPWFTYYKEVLLIGAIIYLSWKHLKWDLKIHWWWIDLAIGVYIIYLVGISIWTTGIRGIIFGWRYDFEFLLMFWTVYHGWVFLKEPASYYLKLFLISSGIMIFLGGLLKFPLTEDLLLYFGYSWNPSVWQFWSVPPIFHGIDGANIRRFQGILDWPNTMWAFLILFSGIFAYFVRDKKSWYFVNGIILFSLFIMILYTYSRSALLWTLAGYSLVIFMGIRFLFSHYKKEFITISLIGILGIGILFIQYAWTFSAIVGRAWSTKWHLERMKISVERFIEKPFWQWLGSSGPAYRHTQDLTGTDRKKIEEMDKFYIPESWYIQQFVEGWIIGGISFLIIMGILFFALIKKHVILGWMFMGIAVMNIFLHTFESAPFSLLFFILIGILLSYQNHGKGIYKR